MRVLTALFMGLVAASPAMAQARTIGEVGTSLGVTVLRQSNPSGFGASTSTSATVISAPGNGIQAAPTLYLTLFATPSVMIEPQVAFMSFSENGATSTAIGIGGQFGYLFKPSAPGSAYLSVTSAFASFSTSAGSFSSSRSGPGLGAALGYRFKVKTKVGASLAVRFDARYRRWFSDFKNLSEYGFGIGLGGLF